MTSRRGRHAAPRLAARAWLVERRLQVLIIASGVAAAALIGGSVAVLQLTAPSPDDEAALVTPTTRPTSTDPEQSSAFHPITPSPAPGSPLAPATPDPAPVEPPAGEASEPLDESPVAEPEAESDPEPGPGEESRRDTAPGATNRPDKPRD